MLEPKPIIARKRESERLKQQLARKDYSLVAVYGRRRVGKTYLIENILKEYIRNHKSLYLCLTGNLDEKGNAISSTQLMMDFRVSCIRYLDEDPEVGSPHEIFIYLSKLAGKCEKTNRKLVLFLDEFPWLSVVVEKDFNFLRSFEHLLNNVLIPSDAKVFLSGSATTWMLQKLVYSKTGLAKRLTQKIKLNPFNLRETKDYAEHIGVNYSHYSLIELHMAIGGIPYYLDKLNASKSLIENLYELIIQGDGLLSGKQEYNHLFSYLFKDPEYYKRLVSLFASRRYGLGLSEIQYNMEGKKKTKPSQKLLDALACLHESNILDKRIKFGNKKKGIYYFLIDEYIRFYNKWVAQDKNTGRAGFFQLINSQSYKIWSGFNFELLCIKHIKELIEALGITGIDVNHHIYYKKNICQIDLLLDRSDRTITICEAKFLATDYEMSKSDYEQMIRRRQELELYLKKKRERKRDFNFCLIHYNGVKTNKYIEMLRPRIVSAESFF